MLGGTTQMTYYYLVSKFVVKVYKVEGHGEVLPSYHGGTNGPMIVYFTGRGRGRLIVA